MANSEHLAILKQGVPVWNKWRKKHPRVRPNLTEADLSEMDLIGANFSGATLARANLSANKLIDTDFSYANLFKAKLRESDLFRAILISANLTEVDLANSDLTEADLHRANLSNADLTRSILRGTTLDGVILCGVLLYAAHLIAPDLRGANLSGSKIGYNTTFTDVDLSEAIGLSTIHHQSPSSIGIDTVYRSRGIIPEDFLRGCGVPETFIIYARALVGKAIDFYSCFISHSTKDRSFCERLYTDLQAKGVRVWYFPEDAKWGETVWGEIDRSIKVYDKLIVVLSENSLQSGPVLREIERALNREDKEGKNILFPIAIDDFIFRKDKQGNDVWQHPRRADMLAKVVGDFSGWDKDATKHEKAFDKLLKGLQAEG